MESTGSAGIASTESLTLRICVPAAERLSGNESGDLLDSDDDDDGDLDSYVEGMFNPSDADEEDDNDDFEAYMKELQGSDEPCIDGSDGEEDVSIGSDDLDLGELEESS
mmetsp:Transcript_32784/g.77717  ORF Transcript_32784/g.77717 Transcript_32784/m.77717 type:complete len:109 (+) Transcript_32784:294-620(+)|eukprot:CAMPEP_0177603800 /NCGR_PEP_ID=MMETSP0419_2-20121207/15733_1 /TAXON_ID=582737 /ORGANISM="Tetraselmis sp., Strain GSL018" /LENGTH=108 /DNA_ID=CAMNT_0019097651 /DNA_START=267 /DNA_END=593 /DNA_ORIENTATION=+